MRYHYNQNLELEIFFKNNVKIFYNVFTPWYFLSCRLSVSNNVSIRTSLSTISPFINMSMVISKLINNY